MARTRVQAIRSNVTGARPSGREPGEIFTNWPDRQIGVVDAGRQPVDLVAVRYFSATASYTPGQLVVQNGKVYRATAVISPGAFDPTKWQEITVQSGSGIWVGDSPRAEAPVQGQLLWESDSGDLFVWYEDADSGQWVQINVVGSVNQTVWLTRGQLVADVAAGFTVSDGVVITVDGHQYIGETGATAIPDLPGLLPFGDTHVEHFGAVADLAWDIRNLGVYTGSSGTTGGNAPWRISGTDNFAKIQLANDYVTDAGIGVFYLEGGDYYSIGQLVLTSRMVSRNNFANTLWMRYTLLQRGILVMADNSGVEGLQLVPQYWVETGEVKPYGRGDLGCAITVNEIFLPVGQQTIKRNLRFDVRFCRAGLDVATPANQRSSGSILIFCAAGIEQSNFRVGLFGETNIGSSGLFVAHWGGEYSAGDPLTGYSDMVLTATHHFCDNHVEFVGDIDNIAKPHGLSSVMTLTGPGSTEWGDITCRGVAMPVFIFPGDSCGAYANEGQREKIMRGLRGGFINARDVPSDTDTSLPAGMRGGGDAMSFNGVGTMAAFTFDLYEGTSIPISRQIDVDIEIKGVSLARGVYPPLWGGRGVFLCQLSGRVDLGTVITYGWGRGLDFEHCHGEQIARYAEGDATLYLTYNSGTRILDSRVDKGDNVGNAADGQFSPGYAASNKCVYVVGRTFTTTTTADAAAGATKTMATPTANDVFVGDLLQIGTYWVKAIEFIQNGVPYLKHEPLPAAVSSGATVTVDQTGRVRELHLSSSSGQTGLDCVQGAIDHLDLSQFGWAGQRAVALRTKSRANIVGLIPPTVGRIDPVSGNDTIWCDSTSFAKVTTGSIPTNPRVNSTFKLTGGTVHLDKCRVENVATLLDPALALVDKIGRLGMLECEDFLGASIAHPFRKGGAGGAAGWYHAYEDGSLIQWVRNQVTDGAGTFTWTFPCPFIAAGTTSVVASAVSAVNPGFVQPAASAGTTSVVVKAWNISGAAAAIAFHAVAKGRWFV